MASLLENSLLREHTPEALFLDAEAKNDRNGYRWIQLLFAMKQAMTSVKEYKRQKPRFLTEEPVKLIGEISGRQLAYVGAEGGVDKSVLMEVLEFQDKWVDRFDELLPSAWIASCLCSTSRRLPLRSPCYRASTSVISLDAKHLDSFTNCQPRNQIRVLHCVQSLWWT
jgi:hypothetical protein